MKNLFVLIALGFSTAVCPAQEVQELNEARVEAVSPSFLIRGSNLTFKIPENYSGEFEANPLLFMKSHFDIKPVIAQLGEQDEYQVTFKSRKGHLQADFDKGGNLVYYSLRFKDVLVPYQLMVQLYKDHKGWALVRTIHQAKGNGDKPGRVTYKVRMQNGNKKKDLEYYTNLSPNYEIEGNFDLVDVG